MTRQTRKTALYDETDRMQAEIRQYLGEIEAISRKMKNSDAEAQVSGLRRQRELTQLKADMDRLFGQLPSASGGAAKQDTD